MKKIFKISIMVLAFLGYSLVSPKPVQAQQGYISFQVFYDQLNPYGQWVNYPGYGYVWVPDAGPDFSPYRSNGYWIMTDYGWTWLSNYPWGWIPFHYGRWDFDDNIGGWFWVPDNEWGPCWVTWRRSNGYYGWIPMRPGISISLSFGNTYRDVDHWCFIRDRDFGRPDMYRYYVNHRDNDAIIRNSVVINTTYRDNRRNVTYIAGPPREEVQRYTGRNFRRYRIEDNDKPGQRLGNNRLAIYRPQVVKINDDNHRPVPPRVVDARDVRTSRERNSNYQQNNTGPTRNDRRVETQPRRVEQQPGRVEQQPRRVEQQPRRVEQQPQQSQEQRQNQRVEQPSRREAQQQAQPQRSEQERNQVAPQQQNRRSSQVQPQKKNETGVKNNRRREKRNESAPPEKKNN
jgi:hypothetical protein